MKLGYTILYVPDVTAAIGFYEVAFGLERRFVDDENTYGELKTGDTVLAFASEELSRQNGVDARPTRPGEPAPGFELAFVTDDVEAAIQRATEHGAELVQPAADKPWGQVVGYVRDLNGVLVEICTAMGG